MVSVTLLVVIIFSLYKMFDQTQRAFRGGVKLVDVMEGGRAATEFQGNITKSNSPWGRSPLTISFSGEAQLGWMPMGHEAE